MESACIPQIAAEGVGDANPETVRHATEEVFEVDVMVDGFGVDVVVVDLEEEDIADEEAVVIAEEAACAVIPSKASANTTVPAVAVADTTVQYAVELYDEIS